MGAVALLGAPLAFYAFFSGYQEYDDEGYLLISLREYARGGVLYDEVYSQYGPLYYQLIAPLFRLARLAFTHTHGRAIAMALLLATAFVAAAATYRLTRSLVVTVATELLILQALLPSRNEPLHPGAVLALLLSGLVLAASFLEGPGGRPAAVALGVLVAALLLVKVNIGIFAAASVTFALLSAGSGVVSARLYGAGAAAMALLPLFLLAPRWEEPSVRVYLVVVLASILGVIALTLDRPPSGGTIGPLLRGAILAGAITVLLSAGWEFARGTTAAGFADGTVFGPLRHTRAFFFGPDLGPGALACAVAGLAIAVVWAWARRQGLTTMVPVGVCLALGQLLGGLVLWLAVMERLPLGPLAVTPPLLWIALAGRRDDVPSLAVLVLVSVASLQSLHAYPIAGTQVAWATFLAIPVGGVAIVLGCRRTVAALTEAGVLTATRLVPSIWLGIGLLTVTMSGVYATYRQLQQEYAQAVPFGMPGADGIRVPADQAALYQLLVEALSTRCRTFVTQPGLNSLYLFTGMEPPTRLNTTVWMLLLSDRQQNRIVDRLARATPPVCALRRQRRSFTTPLARYIDERFVTLFRVEFFEFRIQREPAAANLPSA